jgi:hypothetical protein
MTRETPNTAGNDADQALARRFARLRAAEADCAPPLSGTSAADASALSDRHRPRALPWLVAASVLVAAVLTVLTDQPEDDPAALYASIMARQEWQTDILLEVSEGTLPAMSSSPRFYDPNIEWGPGNFNQSSPYREE